MKQIFTFAFLVISLFIQGQDDQRRKDSMILFAPTAMGELDGEPASRMMNKDGGRLMSIDKKAELIIPPGALSSETMISIQPVINLAAGGVGKTYRFEPSGLQFLQPAQLIFHYTDKDAQEDSPQLLSISTQNDQGSWFRLREIKVDTISKTITASTLHFTEFAVTWTLVMWPEANRVKVNKQILVQLYLSPLNTQMDHVSNEQIMKGHFQWFNDNMDNARDWSVNGIANGNAAVGKIIKPEVPATTMRDMFQVFYKAPAMLPDQNPVEIKIELKGVEMDGKFITVKRTCKVLIYDDVYEVNMISEMKGGSIKEWGGKMKYRDQGWFYVSLDKKEPEILKIQNLLDELIYDNCPDRKILNPSTHTGIFHVTGIKQVKITPANPPAQLYRIVEIWFQPHPVELTQYTFNCPPPPGTTKDNSKGKVDLTTAARGQPPILPMFMGMPALPSYLKFIANDKEQIFIEMGKPGDDLYYKIWVKKLNEDAF